MTDGTPPFLVDRKGLTLAACRAAMQAALDEAQRNGLAVTVAILDAGGQLLNLSRMDGIHAGTVEVAIAKARCAVQFKRPTKVFAEAYAGGATALTALPGMLPYEGGVPIILDGHIVGAVGASGASPEQDGAIATAGVNAILASGA
jgi:uncharacterized protein GlcG (DUF336 family)